MPGLGWVLGGWVVSQTTGLFNTHPLTTIHNHTTTTPKTPQTHTHTLSLCLSLYSVLLAQTIAFRRVLQQRAPPDALTALCPVTPDARNWLQRRQSARAAAVRQWLEGAAGPSGGSPNAAAAAAASPASPVATAGGGGGSACASGSGSRTTATAAGWLGGWGGSSKAAAAGSSRQRGAADAAGRNDGSSGNARATKGAAGLTAPLLAPTGDEEAWGSGSGDGFEEYGSAASQLAGSSVVAASFCTAVSQQAGDSADSEV